MVKQRPGSTARVGAGRRDAGPPARRHDRVHASSTTPEHTEPTARCSATVVEGAGVARRGTSGDARPAHSTATPSVRASPTRAAYRMIVATSIDGQPASLGGLGPCWAVYDAGRLPAFRGQAAQERFRPVSLGPLLRRRQAGLEVRGRGSTPDGEPCSGLRSSSAGASGALPECRALLARRPRDAAGHGGRRRGRSRPRGARLRGSARRAWPYRAKALVVLHKPAGVECSRRPAITRRDEPAPGAAAPAATCNPVRAPGRRHDRAAAHRLMAPDPSPDLAEAPRCRRSTRSTRPESGDAAQIDALRRGVIRT